MLMAIHYSWSGSDSAVCLALHLLDGLQEPGVMLIPIVGSTKMEASFTNHSTGQPTIIELHGDFWGGAADLSIQGGPVVAQITRDAFSMREVFTNSQVVRLICMRHELVGGADGHSTLSL